MGVRRALNAAQETVSGLRRVLVLMTVIALLVGFTSGQSFAATNSVSPATPVQHSGTAAGKSHRAKSALQTRKRTGPLPAVVPQHATAKRVNPLRLSNVPKSAAPKQAAARMSSVAPNIKGKKEIVGLRAANRSVYDDGNGSYTAQVFSQPIHYRDASGNWQSIDTGLVQQRDGTWQEQANSSTPVFAANGAGGALMTDDLGDHESMAVGVRGAGAVEPLVSGNTITYPGILPGASVSYAANTSGVKETLVLNNASAPTTWFLPLTLHGLTASLDSDGAVDLTDSSGDIVQTIPHGFMEDSDLDPRTHQTAQSGGVTYSLVTVGGQQELRVDLDPTWVHDPARVFPIDVDPTQSPQEFTSGSTYVMSPFNNDYSSDSVLKVGTYDGGSNVANSYMLFNLSGLANDYVESANLWMNDVWSYSCLSEPVSISPIRSNWAVTGLKTYPWVSYGSAIASSSFSAGNCSGAAYEKFDLGDNPSAAGTKLIEQWTHGGQNLGLAVTASTTDTSQWKQFASINSSNPPYLLINYSPYGAAYSPASTYTVPTGTVNGSQQVTITNQGNSTWAPGSESLGYQLFTTSWSKISVGATTTALTGSVAPNHSITLTGTIGKLTPGQYILCWDMMVGSSSFNVTYGVPTATCEVINSANTPPQIDSMSPLSNSTLGTLTPTLSATGHDPDNYPGSGLTYDFQVYTNPSDGSSPALVVDSGMLAAGVTTYTVPTGDLSWNQSYFWQVLNSDSVGESNWSTPDTFSLAVQQPLITSHLGSAATGASFDAQVGDYLTAATDAQVAVAGPALAVHRSYNSQDPRTGNLFGAGWSTIYDMQAAPDSDGSGNVVITYPDGQELRFGLNGDGSTFTPPQGVYSTLRSTCSGNFCHPSAGYQLTDRGGTTYSFLAIVGSVYKLSSIIDPQGRTENLTYTSGQLTTVTNTASNRALHLTWTNGHVSSVATDPVTSGGQPLTWTYGYSGNVLTSVCSPTSATQCTTYSYTSGANGGSHYRSLVLDAQPSGYWRLGDASGSTTAADEVATNMGADNGTYSVSTFGHARGPLAGSPENSAYFGGNAGVTLPPNLVSSTPYLTVQLWFQTGSAGGPAGVLFSTGHSAVGASNPSGGAMPVLYVGTDGKLYGQFWTGSVTPVVSSAAVNDGRWHQVTLVGQGTTQSMYLDGALVGSSSGKLDNIDPLDIVGAGYVNSNPWQHAPAAGWSYFTGNIGEVAFYAHPLGAPAIAQQYQGATQIAQELTGVTTPNGNTAASVSYDDILDRATSVTDDHGGTWTLHPPVTADSYQAFRNAELDSFPVDFFPFNESSGAQAINALPQTDVQETSDGNGDYANVTLGEPGPVAGSPDTAAGFNGASSSMTYPADDGNLAFGLWFKTTTAGGVLIQQGGVPLMYVGSDGQLHADYNGTGLMSSGTTVTDGKWHYADFEGDYPDQEQLYLDGSQVDSVTSQYNDGQTGPTVVVGAGTVAGTAAAAPANGYFSGSIADFGGYQGIGGYGQTASTVASVWAAAHQAQTTPMPVTTATVTDPGSATITYRYDPLNSGRILTSTDGLGNTTTYSYDSNGFPSRVQLPDDDGPFYQYDSRGNVLEVRTGNSDDQYSYPASGTFSATDPRDDLPLTHTDGDDNQTTFTYSTSGQPLTSTNAVGAVTTSAYTAGTEAAIGGGTEPAGLLASTTDPLGNVTSYAYDSAGDLAKETDPSGLVTNYTYDGLGRMLSQTQVSDTFPSGLTEAFTYDGNGRELTDTGPPTTDAVTGAVHTQRTTNTYDADGNLLTTVESDTTGGDPSRTVTDTYNGHDELATTTDPLGRRTSYGYDGYGNETSETDPAGNVRTRTYDANGDLLTETLDGWTGNTSTPGTPTNLVLDSRAYDPDGLLASVTDAMGRVTDYGYDDAHRLDDQYQHNTQSDTDGMDIDYLRWFDEAGNVESATGAAGDLEYNYSYDAANRLTEKTYDLGGILPGGTPDDVAWEDIPEDEKYTYDADNDLTSQSTVNGSATEETDYTYDASGDQLTRTVQNGASTPMTTSWTYDERGIATSTTQPLGNVRGGNPAAYTTDYTTDADGRTVTTVQPSVNVESGGGAPVQAHPITEVGYDTFGDRTSVSDPDGNITSDTYDADGELLGETQPAYTAPGTSTSVSPTTQYTYTSLGRQATSTDPLGNVTTNTYDQSGDLVQQADPAINGSSPTWNFAYDKDGETLSSTDPTGAQQQTTYDDLGEPMTRTQIVRQPTTTAETTTYQYGFGDAQPDDPTIVTLPNGQSWNYTYSQDGLRLSVTDPLGNFTINTYDSDENLIGVTLPDGTSTKATFDMAGRQTSGAVLDASGDTLSSTSMNWDVDGDETSSTDADGATTTVTYDALGRPVSQAQPVTSTSGITTSVGYDAAGNVTRYTDGNGNNTVYTFNSLGLPESRVEPPVTGYTGPANSTTTIGYDADGNETTQTEPGGVSRAMSYDALGLLTSVSGTGAEATTATQTLGYDADGRITSASTPTGTDTYTYDDRGDLLTSAGPSGSDSYSYNSTGDLTSRTDSTGTATFGYDAAGRMTTEYDPLTASTASYTYNSLNQVTGISYGAGAASQTDTYNSAHELTGQVLKNGSGATEASVGYGYDPAGLVTSKTTAGTAGAATNTYTYDQQDRLTSWNNGTNTTSYGYDADGNRTQAGSVTSVYNARDQLVSSGGTSYTYTARGTTSGQTTGSTTTNFASDALDQLVTAGGTNITYDALGRTASDGHATFTYDGNTDALTSDGTQQFGRGANDQVVSVGASGGATLAFTDQHGDLTGLFTPTGSTLNGSVAFDPWGQQITAAGTQADLGFQSGWTDPNTGYVDTASRWYSPTEGGFTSQDSAPLDPTGPATATNLYAYGDDDPLAELDPSGQSACTNDHGGPGTPSSSTINLPPDWLEALEAILDALNSRFGDGVPSRDDEDRPTRGNPDDDDSPGDGVTAEGFGEGEGFGGGSSVEREHPEVISSSSRDCGSGSGSGGGSGGSGGSGGRPTPPPPPLGDRRPVNGRPTSGQGPGETVTPQPGTKTGDSGPADSPVDNNLIGETNPALNNQPTFSVNAAPTPSERLFYDQLRIQLGLTRVDSNDPVVNVDDLPQDAFPGVILRPESDIPSDRGKFRDPNSARDVQYLGTLPLGSREQQMTALLKSLISFAKRNYNPDKKRRTFVGAINTQTGEAVLAGSGGNPDQTDQCSTYCAEGNAYLALGASRSDIMFTWAVTIKLQGKKEIAYIKPVCERCQGDFAPGNFMPGTLAIDVPAKK